MDLETICHKCLEKSPSKRYSTAGALADDLNRYLIGLPVVARRVTLLGRVWRLTRRNKTVAMMSATLFCLLVVFIMSIIASNSTLNASLDDAEKQLNRYRVSNGLRLIESGDFLMGMAWLAQPLTNRTAAADSRTHQERLNLYWQLHSRPTLLNICAHPAPIRCVSFSADGRRLLLGSDDGTGQIWDVVTAKPISPPFCYEKTSASRPTNSVLPMRVAALSPDGSQRRFIREIPPLTAYAFGTPLLLNHFFLFRFTAILSGTLLLAQTANVSLRQATIRQPESGIRRLASQSASLFGIVISLLMLCTVPDGRENSYSQLGQNCKSMGCRYR